MAGSTQQAVTILSLPADVIMHLFCLLAPNDALSFKLTCKQICNSTPSLSHHFNCPLLLAADLGSSKSLRLFCSELDVSFLLPYELQGAEVKFWCSERHFVLIHLDLDLVLLNVSTGSMTILPSPTESYEAFVMHVVGEGVFQIFGLSSPSPLVLRIGYCEGKGWEDEDLKNQFPFELCKTSAVVLIDDELYSLGKDGSVGYYSREGWIVIRSTEPAVFEVAGRFTFESNGAFHCLLHGPDNFDAMVLNLDERLWQRTDNLADLSIFSTYIRSYAFEAEVEGSVTLGMVKQSSGVIKSSIVDTSDSIVLLLDRRHKALLEENIGSSLLNFQYPGAAEWEDPEYSYPPSSIWINPEHFIIMLI